MGEKKYYDVFWKVTKKWVATGFRSCKVVSNNSGLYIYQEVSIPVYVEPGLSDGWYVDNEGDVIEKVGMHGTELNGRTRRWDTVNVTHKINGTVERLEK